MKKNKGFALITVIFIIVALAAGGYYFVKTKNSDTQNLQPIVDKKIDNVIDNTDTKTDKVDNNVPDKKIDYVEVNSKNVVVNANNQFAFDIYPNLVENEKGKNAFFSPFSISSALGMVYEGANGKTADEIRSVFHFSKDINTLRTSFASINNEINKASNDYKLSVANALWTQKDYKFLDEYISNVDKYYNAKATNVDFKNDTEGARLTINKWVEDKTNDKIKDIISKGVLNSLTRLVLSNAIYFNGKWDEPFNKKETKADITFMLDSQNSVKVNMMQQDNNDKTIFNYAENKDLQILEMPYKGNELSMTLILPKKNDIASFEKLFTLSNFNSWKKDLKKQRVDVFVPQFKFDTKYSSIEDTLKSMGMPTAFCNNGDADFSKMDGTRDLYISKVIHQAFVDVNEDGTEAAAATAVVMAVTSLLPNGPIIPKFYANHPFLFVIQNTTSGNILFMGRVVNPNLK